IIEILGREGFLRCCQTLGDVPCKCFVLLLNIHEVELQPLTPSLVMRHAASLSVTSVAYVTVVGLIIPERRRGSHTRIAFLFLSAARHAEKETPHAGPVPGCAGSRQWIARPSALSHARHRAARGRQPRCRLSDPSQCG